MAKLFLVLVGLTSSVYGQGLNAPFANNNAVSFNRPLQSEAYSEGACFLPQVATNADPSWVISQKTFYTPIASQFAHHRFAETLLSRPPNNEAELDSMCLTVEFTTAGSGLNITNIGYDDREFRETCPQISPGRLSCQAVGSSAGVNPRRTISADHFVVSVDNRSYMLLVRCVDGFFRDYILLTTRPSVSLETYNIVLNATRNLGFDERRLQLLSYDNCIRSNAVLNNSNLQLDTRRNAPGAFPLRPRNPFNSYLTAPFARSIGGNNNQYNEFSQYNPGLNPVSNANIPGGIQGLPPGVGGVPPPGLSPFGDPNNGYQPPPPY